MTSTSSTNSSGRLGRPTHSSPSRPSPGPAHPQASLRHQLAPCQVGQPTRDALVSPCAPLAASHGGQPTARPSPTRPRETFGEDSVLVVAAALRWVSVTRPVMSSAPVQRAVLRPSNPSPGSSYATLGDAGVDLVNHRGRGDRPGDAPWAHRCRGGAAHAWSPVFVHPLSGLSRGQQKEQKKSG